MLNNYVTLFPRGYSSREEAVRDLTKHGYVQDESRELKKADHTMSILQILYEETLYREGVVLTYEAWAPPEEQKSYWFVSNSLAETRQTIAVRYRSLAKKAVTLSFEIWIKR